MKQLKCQACGKMSLMKAYVKDSSTWPPEEKKPQQQAERQLTEQEVEKKRIEDSSARGNIQYVTELRSTLEDVYLKLIREASAQ